MKKYTLKAIVTALALAASALFVPTTAQAETTACFYYNTEGGLEIIVLYFTEEGDAVQEELFTYCVNHGIYIQLECAPGLIVECVDGIMRAVRAW